MIIAIANQKGGVGKSTTAQALAAKLTALSKRTLLIDLDAQINTSVTVGADMAAPSIFDVLMGRATAAEAVQETSGAAVISGASGLYDMDSILTKTGKEYTLKIALTAVARNYEFIILDTPPALGILNANALTAANGIIIPACAEPYGLQGIAQLAESIKTIRRFTNKKLWTMGILLTRIRRMSIMQSMEDYAAEIAKANGTSVYKTVIRESKVVKEAQGWHKSIYDHAPTSTVAEDYTEFAKEFLSQAKKGQK